MNKNLFYFESEPFEFEGEAEGDWTGFQAEGQDPEWEAEMRRRRRQRGGARPTGRVQSRRQGQRGSSRRPPRRYSGRPYRPRPVVVPAFTVIRDRQAREPDDGDKRQTREPSREPSNGSSSSSPGQQDVSQEPTISGSEYVRWIQSSLNQILGLNLPLDGVMGVETRSAVRSFQEKQGLPADGVVGPDTERALQAARSGQGKAGGDNQAAGKEEEGFFEVEPYEIDLGAGEFETFDTEWIGEGWEGEVNRSSTDYVRWVQQSLNRIMGLRLAVDGIMGPKTRSAVRGFQQRHGLIVDGVVGPQTERGLLAAGAGGPPGAAPSPYVPSPTPSQPSPGPVPSNKWVLPPDVRAAGERQYVRYDSPPPWENGKNCTNTFTLGAAELKDYIRTAFRGVSSIGGYSCRPNTGNTAETSVHGTGRALDIMIPTVNGRANTRVGDPIANWLVQNAQAIGVQYIIWNRVRWSGYRSGRKDGDYGGPNPHIDHIHVELNRDGAARSTPWFSSRRSRTRSGGTWTGEVFEGAGAGTERETEFRVVKAITDRELAAGQTSGAVAYSSIARSQQERKAVEDAIARGQRDVNTLTDMIFFARHRERNGKSLVKGEPGFDRLAREWVEIRDQLVRPLLSQPVKTPAPSDNPPAAFPSRSLAVLKQKVQDAVQQGQISPDYGQQVLDHARSRILLPLPQVRSRWGWRKMGGSTSFHEGVDLVAPMHTRIMAVRRGRVARVSYDPDGFGNYIVIDHGRDAGGNRHYTLYAHNDQLTFGAKDIGKVVEPGQLIALSGTTGKSTGPHLHYEVRVIQPNGPGPTQWGFFNREVSVDPQDYIWPESLTLY